MNPNSNNSNNVEAAAIPHGLNPNGNRKLDVSPVFDKLGNRIGIRRYTGKWFELKLSTYDTCEKYGVEGQVDSGDVENRFITVPFP